MVNPVDTGPKYLDCDEAQREFALENFKALRDEIIARVGHHQRLMWGKVAASGVFIGFLLTSLPDEALRGVGFAAVPAVAIIFDFLIGKNVRAIHCLGIFAKDELELGFYGLEMWESKGGQVTSTDGVRNYGPTDAVVLGAVTAGIIGLTAFMMFREWADPPAAVLTVLWVLVFAVSFYKVAIMISYEKGRHMDAVDLLIERLMKWSRPQAPRNS